MTELADINARPPNETAAMILQHTRQKNGVKEKWRYNK